jgi:hypothetical protein
MEKSRGGKREKSLDSLERDTNRPRPFLEVTRIRRPQHPRPELCVPKNTSRNMRLMKGMYQAEFNI